MNLRNDSQWQTWIFVLTKNTEYFVLYYVRMYIHTCMYSIVQRTIHKFQKILIVNTEVHIIR